MECRPDISDFEHTLRLWEEEIKLGPDKTTLRPKHIRQLKKKIDTVYVRYTKIRQYEERVAKWIDGAGQ